MGTRVRLTEQNYRELFENASDAIWVQDMEGNIVDANKACEKLSGFSHRELLRKNVKEFITGEFLELAREIRHKLLNGEELAQALRTATGQKRRHHRYDENGHQSGHN